MSGDVKVTIRYEGYGKGPLSTEDIKKILGWTVVDKGHLFVDREGNKIALKNNSKNRPFRMSLADRWSNEFLRNKWEPNGEPLIIDSAGQVQSGQHRGIGAVLAEQTRKENPDPWKRYGTRGPIMWPTIIVEGISTKKEVADTIDGGQKRSLGDVLFRNHEFKGSKKEQQKLANVLSGATRLCWIRVGGKTVSDAPHFPHTEALDFIKHNPKLRDAVEYVVNEDGGSGAEGRRITSLVSLGYAAGLMYLMGTAKTKLAKVEEEGPSAISTSLWSKAEKFWAEFASGANLAKDSPVLVLRNLLVKIDAGSGSGRDETLAIIVKAWNAWVDGVAVESKDIKVKKTKTEDGRFKLAETPRIGGLDVEIEVEEIEEAEEVETSDDAEEAEEKPKKGKKAKKTKAGKTPKKNEWVWVKADDEPAWKAKVVSIDGDSCVVQADDGGDEFTVATSDVHIDNPD